MHFNQLAYDRKAQTSARGSQHKSMFAAIEAFKDAGLIFHRNAYAIIYNIHLHFIPIDCMDIHTDSAVLGRIVIGVVHKVRHDLTYAL